MRFLKKYLPKPHYIKNSSGFGRIAHWFARPDLWHFNRRSVAVGVAAGLFVAVIPLPVQMLLAALLALIFRGNVPVAAAMTWVTNPFTAVPAAYLIYKTGALLTHETTLPASFSFATLGKNFFIGLPIVAVCASLLGFLLVHLVWRIYIHAHLFLRGRRRGKGLS